MQQSLAIEPNTKLAQKRVAFSGYHHVLVAVEADPHLASRLRGRERGQRRESGGLRFFATKSAAHSRTLHHHAVHWQCEHVGNNVLHFRWMLG